MGILRRSKAIIASFCAAILVCTLLVHHPVFALESEPPYGEEKSWEEIEAIQETMNKYVVKMEDNTLYFDLVRAMEEQEDELILEAGQLFNLFSAGMKKDANQAMAKISMPIYGKYCGPGHSGPGTPIDALDKACQKHDKCYSKRGYFACSCDKELLSDVVSALPYLSGKGLVASVAIRTYFMNAPCNPLK